MSNAGPSGPRLSTREGDLDEMASDFGHMVRRRPRAVLHPRAADEVATTVRLGRSTGVPVGPRGTGYTVDGQAQVGDGIVVNLATLAEVGRPEPDRISVGAGASWRSVVDATLPAGRTPPVVPDYLALSVGGTLSVGGLAGTSPHHGCVVDNVHELDVVTPAGELVTCSARHRPDLFDAVRGTQGEHGIIVRATLALGSAPERVVRFVLSYSTVDELLVDQQRLMTEGRFHHVSGQVQAGTAGGWRFLLEAATFFTPPERPDETALLADLRHDRAAELITTMAYAEFLGRLEPFVATLRSAGSWHRDPHPRVTVLLPGRSASTVVADTLAGLSADLLGFGGGVLLYPIPTARITAPNVSRPRDPVAVVFALQRTAPAGDAARLAQMRAGNEALRERARHVGGVEYALATAFHDARARIGHA